MEFFPQLEPVCSRTDWGLSPLLPAVCFATKHNWSQPVSSQTLKSIARSIAVPLHGHKPLFCFHRCPTSAHCGLTMSIGHHLWAWHSARPWTSNSPQAYKLLRQCLATMRCHSYSYQMLMGSLLQKMQLDQATVEVKRSASVLCFRDVCYGQMKTLL